MSAIFSVLATLLIAGCQSRSSPLFVTYVSAPYPTCGGVTDGACLARLGVPGYADHPYNIVNLAFYVPDGAAGLADATAVWNNPGAYMSSSFKQTLTGSSNPSASQIRTAIKKKFSDAGVKLLLSVFGGTSHPMNAFSEASITQSNGLCDKIANVVLEQDYDGVDVDFEQTSYFQSGTAESWLCTLTNCLREKLGYSKILSHAPQAPYMGASYGSSAHYPNGGYLKVHQLCGDKIDFYNVQFYNQGSTTYDSFNTLFNTANGWSASTAVYQIINGNNQNGGLSIPADKLVVGKFIRQGVDGSAGWMSSSTAKTVFQTAISNSNPSWNTGYMTWQIYGDAVSNYEWSKTVASAWGNVEPAAFPTPPPSAPASQPVTIPTPIPTPAPTNGGSGGGYYIDVHLFFNSDWWVTMYLTNTNGISITTLKIKAANYNSYLSTQVGWVDSNHGPIYGFSVSPDMKAPFSIKMISSSGQEISSTNIIEVRAAGAKGTMTERMSGSYTEDNGSSDNIAWTVWFAIVFCALLLIGCGIGFICYRKKKSNKQVAFNHGTNGKNHEEIEIGDGANTNTQI